MIWRPRDPESYFRVRTVWPEAVYMTRKVKKSCNSKKKDKTKK